MKKTHSTPERPSRDRVLMDTAWVFAQRGTCSRLAVGAVASIEGRILTTGYNGAPAGLPHCYHDSWRPGTVKNPKPIPDWAARALEDCHPYSYPGDDTVWYYDGVEIVAISDSSEEPPGCNHAVHAEANAIAFAARHAVGLQGAELHVTHMPCKNCAMLIINSGISRVVYDKPYRIKAGVELLGEANVVVEGHGSIYLDDTFSEENND